MISWWKLLIKNILKFNRTNFFYKIHSNLDSITSDKRVIFNFPKTGNSGPKFEILLLRLKKAPRSLRRESAWAAERRSAFVSARVDGSSRGGNHPLLGVEPSQFATRRRTRALDRACDPSDWSCISTWRATRVVFLLSDGLDFWIWR